MFIGDEAVGGKSLVSNPLETGWNGLSRPGSRMRSLYEALVLERGYEPTIVQV